MEKGERFSVQKWTTLPRNLILISFISTARCANKIREHYRNDHPGLSVEELKQHAPLMKFLVRYSQKDIKQQLPRLFTPQELTVVASIVEHYQDNPLEPCTFWLLLHPEYASTEEEQTEFVRRGERTFIETVFNDKKARQVIIKKAHIELSKFITYLPGWSPGHTPHQLLLDADSKSRCMPLSRVNTLLKGEELPRDVVAASNTNPMMLLMVNFEREPRRLRINMASLVALACDELPLDSFRYAVFPDGELHRQTAHACHVRDCIQIGHSEVRPKSENVAQTTCKDKNWGRMDFCDEDSATKPHGTCRFYTWNDDGIHDILGIPGSQPPANGNFRFRRGHDGCTRSPSMEPVELICLLGYTQARVGHRR